MRGDSQTCCGFAADQLELAAFLCLEAEPDSGDDARLRALPGVGGRGQAGRACDELTPGDRGGQDVELTEKHRQTLLGLGFEDEDRLLLGQQELVPR